MHQPKAVTFLDKLASRKGHLIHKLCAKDTTGMQACYLVLVEPQREAAFNKALKTSDDTLNFENYSKVIASCYDDKPTEEVKKLLKVAPVVLRRRDITEASQ